MAGKSPGRQATTQRGWIAQLGLGRSLTRRQLNLVARLQSGATLTHDVQGTGRFRLLDGTHERTVLLQTVLALLDAGVLHKAMLGQCFLNTGSPEQETSQHDDV